MRGVVQAQAADGELAGGGAAYEAPGQRVLRAEEGVAALLGEPPVRAVRAVRRVGAVVAEARLIREEPGVAVKLEAGEVEQVLLAGGELRRGVGPVQLQAGVYVLVEVVEQDLARVGEAGRDLGLQIGLQLVEGGRDLAGGAALLVDAGDAALDVHAGLQRAEHLVARAEDAGEEPELLVQQLEDAPVGLVAAVDEVEHDHVVALAIAVAAADTLLHPLRVPRQVVVDHQRAELGVHPLGGGLGGDHDLRPLAELLDERGAHPGAARGSLLRLVTLQPRGVDLTRPRLVVRAVEGHHAPVVAVAVQKLQQVPLRAARLGKDHRLPLRAQRLSLRQRGLQRRDQRLPLRVVLYALGKLRVASQQGKFLAQQAGGVGLLVRRLRLQLVGQLIQRLVVLHREQVVHPARLLSFETLHQAAQRSRYGEGRGGEQLPQDQRYQGALAVWEHQQLLAAQVLGDALVQPLLFVGRGELLGERDAAGEADVLLHLRAQRPRAHRAEPRAEHAAGNLAGVAHEPLPEGSLVAEHPVIYHADEPVQLHQRVLQGRGGEHQLRRVGGGLPDAPGHPVLRLVDVAQPVRLVHDHKVPADALDLLRPAGGEMVGADHDPVTGVERVGLTASPQPSVGLRVQHPDRQVELLLHLGLPLTPDRRGHQQQDPAPPLGPPLGHHDPRLDGLPEPDLVGEYAAPRERRPEREERRVHLMRVEVHAGVGYRARQPLQRVRRSAQCEQMRKMLAVVRGGQDRDALSSSLAFAGTCYVDLGAILISRTGSPPAVSAGFGGRL